MQRAIEGITRDTRRYVSIPSVSGDEHRLAKQVATDLQQMGHKPQTLCDANDVLVHIPGKNRNSLFVVNGHLDTVPVRRTFSTRRSGQWLIGPGAGDMKAGLAVMVDMAREYAKEKPDCDVILSFVPMEEVNGWGASQHALWISTELGSQYEEIGGVILEPTYDRDKGAIGFGHRGGATISVSAQGKGGHAGKKFAHTAATDRLGSFVADRRVIQELLRRSFSDDFGMPIINIVNLETAYLADNVVPPSATAKVAIRTTQRLADEWDLFVQLVQENYGVTVQGPAVPADLAVSFCDPDSRTFEVFSSVDLPLIPFPYYSDQPNFASHGIPMMIYGPGDVHHAHGSDRVDLRAIGDCRENMRASVREYALFQRSAS